MARVAVSAPKVGSSGREPLIISKQVQKPTNASFAPGAQSYRTPVYNISIVRKNGAIYNTQVAL